MNDSLKMFLVALITAVGVQLLLGPYILRLQGVRVDAPQTTISGPVEGPQPAGGQAPTAKLAAPNLQGMSVAEARRLFQAKGISIVEEAERGDPEAKPGTILLQRPAAGAVLTNMEIRVTVAKAEMTVQVPPVIGQKIDEARSALVEAGFEVPEATHEASDKPVGTVIKQVPNPGANAKRGSIVRLVVSQAPAVAVPQVTGKYLRRARQMLEEAGLKVGSIRRVEHPEHGQNYVLSQTPDAESQVPPGTEVDLVIVAPN